MARTAARIEECSVLWEQMLAKQLIPSPMLLVLTAILNDYKYKYYMLRANNSSLDRNR